MFASFKSFFTAVRDFFTADPYSGSNVFLLAAKPTSGGTNITFADAGPNGLAVTRAGDVLATGASPFAPSWSGYFDGTGDYLTIPSSSGFVFGTGDFTVEAWVRTTQTTRFEIASRYNGDNAASWGFAANINMTGSLHFYIGNDVIASSAANVWELGTWNHLVVSRSGGTTRLFANGTQVASSTVSINVTDNGLPLYVSQAPSGTGGLLNGNISNLRVVKGTAVYTAAFTPTTEPLTAISGTSLLTLQDNRFRDNSSNNLAITRFGDVSVQPFSPFPRSYSGGGSAYFDGTGDYLQSPNNSAFQLGTGDFTVELWWKGEASGTYTMLAGTQQAGFTDGQWRLGNRFNSANKVYFARATGTVMQEPVYNVNVNDGQWHHIACVRASGVIGMYVDGIKRTPESGSEAISGTCTSANAFRAGFNEINNAYVNGHLSNLRVVKGTAVYTAAFTPPTEPLTAISGTSLLLPLDDGAAIDATGLNRVSLVGNTSSSTTAKFADTGSVYFDGVGDTMTAPHSNGFNFPGDFTIDFWVQPVSGTQNGGQIIGHRRAGNFGTNGAADWAISTNTSNGTIALGYDISGSQWNMGTYTLGQWSHHAISRSGSTIRTFKNGELVTTATNSGAFTVTAGLELGNSTGNGIYYKGYMQDVRVTKGVARYTEAFTPPTQPFGPTVNVGALPGGTLYVATSSGLSISTDGGKTFINRTTANGLGNDLINSVSVFGSTVYAPTLSGLSVSTDGGATFSSLISGVTVRWGLFVSGSNIYAATTAGMAISTDSGATFAYRTTSDGVGSNNCYGLAVNGSNIYVATFSGLSISTDGGATFINRTTANGLGNNLVTNVFADGANVYAATNGGLSISTDGGATFINRTTANGLGSNTVKAVIAAGSTVYAATTAGLSISTDGGATFINRTTANGLGSDNVGYGGPTVSGSNVCVPTTGGLSISTDGGATFTNRNTSDGLASNTVQGVTLV